MNQKESKKQIDRKKFFVYSTSAIVGTYSIFKNPFKIFSGLKFNTASGSPDKSDYVKTSSDKSALNISINPDSVKRTNPKG